MTGERNWRKLIWLSLVAVGALIPWLAEAGDVRVYPAKDVDIASYKTFLIRAPKVMTKQGIKENEPTVAPLIAAAIRRELLAKGLTEVSENADVEVNSLGASVSVPQVEALIYNTSFYGTNVIGTAPITTIGRYNKEGTLYVNMIDPKGKKGVWLGMSTRALGKPEKLESDINKAAQALFKKYPALKK